MIATGGKAVEGASIGILMLDAQFPRIPGEVGNALTWDFPVHYKIVRGASPQRVVKERADLKKAHLSDPSGLRQGAPAPAVARVLRGAASLPLCVPEYLHLMERTMQRRWPRRRV